MAAAVNIGRCRQAGRRTEHLHTLLTRQGCRHALQLHHLQRVHPHRSLPIICVSQNTLTQHETYAKLEAQGAHHVEMEMRKMHLQLKEQTIELRSLQQELEGAKAQIRADQQAGAALGAAAASSSTAL